MSASSRWHVSIVISRRAPHVSSSARAERAHGPRIEWGVADEDRAIRGGGSGYRFQPARAARSGRRESIRPARVADIARPNMQRRLHGASRAGPYRQVGSMLRYCCDLQYFLRQLRAGRAKQSGQSQSRGNRSRPHKTSPYRSSRRGTRE